MVLVLLAAATGAFDVHAQESGSPSHSSLQSAPGGDGWCFARSAIVHPRRSGFTRKNNPYWSGHGAAISFISQRDGLQQIYVAAPDGSSPRRLSTGAWKDFTGAWTSDGSRMAFCSVRDHPDRPDIYIMDADGSNQRRVTRTAGADGSPSWSPDDQTIVFASTMHGPRQIYTVRPDGSDLRRATNHEFNDNTPFYSPDGTRILFQSDRAGNPDIWLMDADGGNTVNLTNTPAEEYFPAWAPDGTSISFSSDRDNGDYHIYVAAPDGSNVRRITPRDS